MKIKDELMTYPPTVIKHFMNPKNVGSIPNPTLTINTANPTCNDVIKSYIVISGGVLSQFKFKAFGCAVTIASASIATELLLGKGIDYISQTSELEFGNAIKDQLKGLPDNRLVCTTAATSIIRKLKDHLSAVQK